MNSSIAIVVIAYNRDWSLERLLLSLNKAYITEGTPLIISIDKSNNDRVAQVANSFNWAFGRKDVICHKENLGLRKHILGCGKFFDEFESIIVLEDDLVVSDNFFMYATQTVEKYHDNDKIAGISLYSFGINYQTFYSFIPQPSEYDAYFMQCAQSWGQVWMKKQWKAFEQWYEGHCDDVFDSSYLPESICSWSSKSWLKYHTRYCIEADKYFVYPYISLSSNCGEAGTHLSFSSPVFQRPVAEFDENYKYRLPDFTDNAVRYDGFFEAERIYSALNLKKDELCIDLTDSKHDYGNKPYLLTTKMLNYKVIKSFGLSYTPIEMNIINRCPGEMIYLYDTNEKCSKPRGRNTIMKRILFAYLNNTDIFALIRRIRQYGLIGILKTIFKAL